MFDVFVFKMDQLVNISVKVGLCPRAALAVLRQALTQLRQDNAHPMNSQVHVMFDVFVVKMDQVANICVKVDLCPRALNL